MTSFVRRITFLGVATATGQVVTALNLIVVARLLPQADVGSYSVFISYAMILLPVSLLSYEVLLPNVMEEEVATLLYGVLPLACAIATLTGLGFAAFSYSHAGALALLLFSMAVLRLVEFIGIRAQRVHVIGLVRTLPHVGFLLLLGGMTLTAAPDLDGILWLQVAAFATSAAGLAWVALAAVLSSRPDWPRIWTLLCSRWRNPLFFAPSEIASTAAYNLPVILVARHFGEAMAAQYGVMLRFVMAPVGLVNSVVGNVYHADLARDVRESDPAVRERFRRIRNRLFLLGLVAGLTTYLLLPTILHFLLGPGWETAESLTRLMTPLVAVAIWISPFGVVFYVYERSWELLLLNLAYVAITAAAFGFLTDDLWAAVGLFVVLSVIRFLLMLVRVERFVRIGAGV